jgi:endoglucanase
LKKTSSKCAAKGFRRKRYLWFYILSLALIACGSTPPKAGNGGEAPALSPRAPRMGNSGIEGRYPIDSAVWRHGRLRVVGTRLCDERGDAVQLKGLYLRALKEESKYLNDDCIRALASEWKIDVMRIPFMSAKWYSEPSYIGDARYEGLMDKAVELCERNGIYCIIDWHVLGDGDPMIHAGESWEFFQAMAFKYGAKDHVIYEICNEPNGRNASWEGSIKPYANYVIPAIRSCDPNAVVIVGTSNWSQDVDIAAKDPLSFPNVLYAFHFYSGTHKDELRRRVEKASATIPLFSSEWGNSNYDARGGPFVAESRKWMRLMDEKGIGWCHYALTDSPEEAAILKPGAPTDGDWKESDLTRSGKFMLDYFANRGQDR